MHPDYSDDMSTSAPRPPGAPRGRGNRAGLTRTQIIEAARELDPERITVKAVADRLGVDRAAVHHHISDRETLRELVALDAFAAGVGPVVIPPDADWQEACRLLAVSIHDEVLAAEGHGTRIPLSAVHIALLQPVDHTLRIMMDAGFDDETAARGLAALATQAAAMARERLMTRRATGHPHVPQLLHAIENASEPGLDILRRLATADLVSLDDAQLHAGIDLIIDGMSTRLAASER